MEIAAAPNGRPTKYPPSADSASPTALQPVVTSPGTSAFALPLCSIMQSAVTATSIVNLSFISDLLVVPVALSGPTPCRPAEGRVSQHGGSRDEWHNPVF